MGSFHGELTALLWGGAFAFVWVYAVVARVVVARSPAVRNPQGRLEGQDRGMVFTATQLPPTPAFFRWSLVVEGVHSPKRSFVQTHPLVARVEARGPSSRGKYAVEARWLLEDLFGFTRLEPKACWSATLVVEPVALPFSPPPPPPNRPGPWRPRRAGRRSGDPFDVRPYLPGDDLRRLHWPLYAHSDVLFVRTAEPSPPPTGHQFLVLDTEATTEEDLDDRLGRLITWLQVLDGQGTGWTLVVPAAGLHLRHNPGPALAALSPEPLPDAADPTWPDTITVLTGPGSRGAARLALRLAAAHRRYRPVVVDPPMAVAVSQPWWRRRR